MAEPFYHSRSLFITDVGPMRFYVRPGPLKRHLSPLISHGGGIMCRVQEPGAFLLAEPGHAEGIQYMASTYITDCVRSNRRLSPRTYRLLKRAGAPDQKGPGPEEGPGAASESPAGATPSSCKESPKIGGPRGGERRTALNSKPEVKGVSPNAWTTGAPAPQDPDPSTTGAPAPQDPDPSTTGAPAPQDSDPSTTGTAPQDPDPSTTGAPAPQDPDPSTTGAPAPQDPDPSTTGAPASCDPGPSTTGAPVRPDEDGGGKAQRWGDESSEKSGDNGGQVRVRAAAESGGSGSKGRSLFRREEDLAILQYVRENEAPTRLVTGTLLWKELEQKQLLSRTWQAMKTRYARYIRQNMHRYKLPTGGAATIKTASARTPRSAADQQRGPLSAGGRQQAKPPLLEPSGVLLTNREAHSLQGGWQPAKPPLPEPPGALLTIREAHSLQGGRQPAKPPLPEPSGVLLTNREVHSLQGGWQPAKPPLPEPPGVLLTNREAHSLQGGRLRQPAKPSLPEPPGALLTIREAHSLQGGAATSKTASAGAPRSTADQQRGPLSAKGAAATSKTVPAGAPGSAADHQRGPLSAGDTATSKTASARAPGSATDHQRGSDLPPPDAEGRQLRSASRRIVTEVTPKPAQENVDSSWEGGNKGSVSISMELPDAQESQEIDSSEDVQIFEIANMEFEVDDGDSVCNVTVPIIGREKPVTAEPQMAVHEAVSDSEGLQDAMTEMMEEFQLDVCQVTQALLKNNGEVGSTRLFLRTGLRPDGFPVWEYKDDTEVQRNDPAAWPRLARKYGSDNVAKRVAFLATNKSVIVPPLRP